MLQAAIELQQRAVSQLRAMLNSRNDIVFRAPTGSGKTRMMADLMDRVLAANDNIIFLVSTLSKGNLGQQNYDVFRDCSDRGIYPHLRPYLINTDIGGEERLYIPDGYNVYVLPRDLYKRGSRLMAGSMMDFLVNTVMMDHHEMILIKDECHQATNNLDGLSTFFNKTISCSATPNLRRGQVPDVQISDEDAEQACLIKRIEMGADSDTVDDALQKFCSIREHYRNLLGVNPCLIIQISNKDKAEQEWTTIRAALDSHQELKWMTIMDKDRQCDSNDKVRQLPVARWKDYARHAHSAIDVIVFKMVISEGWDIPRACMLYQVRDTQSRQLDEQVVGRVRRNPRLADFESLCAEAQQLAMTAWVWGVPPESVRRRRQVHLAAGIDSQLMVRTTHLKPLTVRRAFDIGSLLAAKPQLVTHRSIFDLYHRLARCEEEVQTLCYDYCGNDPQRWLLASEHIDDIRRKYNSMLCNYEESMEMGSTVSLPLSTVYTDNGNYNDIADWVWQLRKDDSDFAFDSEAERKWAVKMKEIAPMAAGREERDSGFVADEDDSKARYLWGKNYPAGSAVSFEYYSDGIRHSYPDFVMKDRAGRIHLFEVKSVNFSNSMMIDEEEYKSKINNLKECYRHCARLSGQLFYLPVLKDDQWQITRITAESEDTLTIDQLKASLVNYK